MRIGGEFMNCLVQIKEAQKSYTSTEKIIAQYILEHTHEILNDSAQQLGEKSQTSAAAVIRFSKKLGYKGFSDLKISLARSSQNEEEDIDTVLEEADDLTTLIYKACQLNVSTVQKTYQMINEGQLQKAIEYMINAKTIYLFGVGSSAIVAYDFSQKLLRIGKKAIYNTDIHVQMTFAESMTKDDVAIFISYSGMTAGLTGMAKKLKKDGIPSLSITQNSRNTVAKNTTIQLFVPLEEKEMRIGAISSRTASLVVTDLLYYGVYKYDLSINKNRIYETKHLVSQLLK